MKDVNDVSGVRETNPKLYYSSRFSAVMDEIFYLARGAKTEDYGETWRRTGLRGVHIKLMIKEGRLRQLIWENKVKETAVKEESIRDTLMDMAAYSIYGVIAYDEGNLDGTNVNGSEMEGMLKKALDQVKTWNQDRK